MASSMSRTEKRRRGRPRTDPTSIHLALPADQLAALDAWIRSTEQRHASRPEAIRIILANYLLRRGYLRQANTAAGGTAGAFHARRAAGKQIDRALEDSGQPEHVKARRKRRLTTIPPELAKPGRAKPRSGS